MRRHLSLKKKSVVQEGNEVWGLGAKNGNGKDRMGKIREDFIGGLIFELLSSLPSNLGPPGVGRRDSGTPMKVIQRS